MIAQCTAYVDQIKLRVVYYQPEPNGPYTYAVIGQVENLVQIYVPNADLEKATKAFNRAIGRLENLLAVRAVL